MIDDRCERVLAGAAGVTAACWLALKQRRTAITTIDIIRVSSFQHVGTAGLEVSAGGQLSALTPAIEKTVT